MTGLQACATTPGFWSAGDGTQGFVCTRQALYQLSHIPALVGSFLFVLKIMGESYQVDMCKRQLFHLIVFSVKYVKIMIL